MVRVFQAEATVFAKPQRRKYLCSRNPSYSVGLDVRGRPKDEVGKAGPNSL